MAKVPRDGSGIEKELNSSYQVALLYTSNGASQCLRPSAFTKASLYVTTILLFSGIYRNG